jgi:uncharacterized protein YbjT (DUF2867 family)
MRILLTGATGYIGKRLLPNLLQNGHEVVCCVRDKKRFKLPHDHLEKITVVEIDFLDDDCLNKLPVDIDFAYYLIHSMSGSDDFYDLEQLSAKNFRLALENTNAQQAIYLSGIVNEENLSTHLKSRKNVESELTSEKYALTVLRAGIIIGSGSASYEIIRDLVEKLPIMIAPKWLNTKCQPIGIKNVLEFLMAAMGNDTLYNQHFDIGCPDVLSYKEMLAIYAEERGLKRWIYTVPVMTPKLSSYWLYFITSTSYALAKSLVDSMKVEVVCKKNAINAILDVQPMGYRECLQRTFDAIEMNIIASSWKDAVNDVKLNKRLSNFINPPEVGCFLDVRKVKYVDKKNTLDRVWKLGGKNGWYYGNFLWKFRGYLDKLFGGVGLRRGRTHPERIEVGDSIDFWRVLYADKKEGRLLLFAEMKLPGEAWLEFKIEGDKIIQRAIFRPKGLMGRFYWYSVWIFHSFIFKGMINRIAGK